MPRSSSTVWVFGFLYAVLLMLALVMNGLQHRELVAALAGEYSATGTALVEDVARTTPNDYVVANADATTTASIRGCAAPDVPCPQALAAHGIEALGWYADATDADLNERVVLATGEAVPDGVYSARRVRLEGVAYTLERVRHANGITHYRSTERVTADAAPSLANVALNLEDIRESRTEAVCVRIAPCWLGYQSALLRR